MIRIDISYITSSQLFNEMDITSSYGIDIFVYLLEHKVYRHSVRVNDEILDKLNIT